MMDSTLTQLITPGPITYIMLIGYTILYIVGVENLRQYFSLYLQSLKGEVDEATIVKLEKQLLRKELQEKLDEFKGCYKVFCGRRIAVDDTFLYDKVDVNDTILDDQVDDILRKYLHLKEVRKTRRSIYLEQKLAISKKEKDNTEENK